MKLSMSSKAFRRYRFVLRIAGWFCLGAVALGAANYYHIEFRFDLIRLLFAPKLTFLGLVIAAGTFQ